MASDVCGNFIKIDRKIINWEWWGDINTFRLFMYMLISAYWKDGNYKGKVIPRGSFPSSVSDLAKNTCLTESETRTALKHLQSTGEITSKSTNKFTIFSVENYDFYQSSENKITNKNNNKSQAKAQTINKQLTNPILKEYKESKNINNNTMSISAVNALFEELWSAYPRRKEKAKAYKCYQARLSDGYSEDELLLAVKRYAQECKIKKTEEQFIKHAATFLGPNTPFLDYLGDYKAPSPTVGIHNRFNNFESRDIDVDVLERQLLNVK